jgi:hypothetical protein
VQDVLALNQREQVDRKNSAQKSSKQLQVSPTITGSPNNKKLLAARGGQESSARCGAVEGELHRLEIVARILP